MPPNLLAINLEVCVLVPWVMSADNAVDSYQPPFGWCFPLLLERLRVELIKPNIRYNKSIPSNAVYFGKKESFNLNENWFAAYLVNSLGQLLHVKFHTRRIIFLVQVRLRTEVLRTRSSTRPKFDPTGV